MMHFQNTILDRNLINKLYQVLPKSAVKLSDQKGQASMQGPFEQFSEQVRKAGTEASVLLKQDSGLENKPSSPVKDSNNLVIELGGTNIRVCQRTVDSEGEVTWDELIKTTNSDFLEVDDIPADCNSMEYFLDKLYSQLIDQHPLLSQVDGMAVIWSNAVEIDQREDQAVKGLSGIVASRDNQYQKNEPFIRDLKDGDDLSEMFIECAKNFKIEPDKFIIGNDTVFTATAVPGSVAGGVASTGTNICFLLPDGTLYNTEAGGRIIMTPESPFFTQAEHDYFGRNLNLEELTAGTMLPELFKANLQICSQDEDLGTLFKNSASLLEDVALDSAAIVNILADLNDEEIQKIKIGIRDDFFNKVEGLNLEGLDLEKFKALDDKELSALVSVAKALEARAGSLTGLIFAAGAVPHNPHDAEKPLTVAADSSQRNYSVSKIFQENADRVADLCNVKIVWLEAEGEGGAITAGVQGAARALDGLALAA